MLPLLNRYQIHSICLFIIILGSTESLCQSNINSNDFFNIGISNLRTPKTKISRDVNFPWIERYEVRTETRKFDLARQEYTFRVTPSTPKKRNAQKAIYEHLRDTPDFKMLDSYCDLSVLIHADWVMLTTTSEYIRLFEKLKLVFEDKELVYNKMLVASELDIEELIKLESKKTELNIKIDALERRKIKLLQKYKMNETTHIPFSVISTTEILKKLVNKIEVVHNSESDEINYEIELLEKELNLEKAEQRQIFDFGQIRYQGPHDDLLKERISLGIGFLIPNSGNQKLKILELELEQDELRQRMVVDNQVQAEKLKQDKEALITAIESHHAATSIIEEERKKLKSIAEHVEAQQGPSPIIFLDIEERHIDTLLDSLERTEEILYDFLKFLDRAGNLCVAKSLDLITP